MFVSRNSTLKGLPGVFLAVLFSACSNSFPKVKNGSLLISDSKVAFLLSSAR